PIAQSHLRSVACSSKPSSDGTCGQGTQLAAEKNCLAQRLNPCTRYHGEVSSGGQWRRLVPRESLPRCLPSCPIGRLELEPVDVARHRCPPLPFHLRIGRPIGSPWPRPSQDSSRHPSRRRRSSPHKHHAESGEGIGRA